MLKANMFSRLLRKRRESEALSGSYRITDKAVFKLSGFRTVWLFSIPHALAS